MFLDENKYISEWMREKFIYMRNEIVESSHTKMMWQKKELSAQAAAIVHIF